MLMLWGIFELAMSMIGVYNIGKGIYTIYHDAEDIKAEYRRYQITSEEYLRAQQLLGPSLTESQYHRYEDEFLLVPPP